MGYELHITRAADWGSSLEEPISRHEWETLAGTDARLVAVAGFARADDRPTPFVWRDEDGPSLVWDRAQVTVKGVRSELEVAEIARFAHAMRATLQGDDGERYDDSGRPEE